ncbi:uncharacterized protein AtWU_05273 [Aspergillus tubingensis]|uniref:uncharacterized protein n=1 Tax=Aspergillus tubingensis TaxID=5068 RepID=UPI001579ECAA|nr:uncharacterized protein AtWU_05273 [Aspergillus tubingensis]GFN15472.1 hypothetical protein AtWU_05273 [Aspergillus tubingensis]
MSGSEETEGVSGREQLEGVPPVAGGKMSLDRKIEPPKSQSEVGAVLGWRLRAGRFGKNTGALLWVNPAESLAEQHNGRTSQANWGGL